MASETREAARGHTERWEFRIGAPVYTTDGDLGTLRQVVVDPDDERVTGLLVRADLLPPRDLLIPLDAIERATDEAIQLLWSTREARDRGAYDEKSLHTPLRSSTEREADRGVASRPAGTHASNEPDRPPVRVGLRVEALDGPAGQVHELLVDAASGHATHLVVRHGTLWKRDRLVPVEWIHSVTAGVVTLDATLADLERLPEYQPDEELQAEIVEKWWGDDVIHSLLVYTDISARVRDGVVVLEGYAWSRLQSRRLEELARSVPGVLDVRNEVVTDEDLKATVAAELAHDSRTRSLRVRVDSYLGTVRLEGEAPDRETKETATEVAARVPRVKMVINLIHAVGEEVTEAEPVRPFHPRIGQRVRTQDGQFGHVARVILGVRDRSVTGIVVEGVLPSPPDGSPTESADASSGTEKWPRRQRSVIIPAEWIEDVGDEVKLWVGHRQAAMAPEFQPGDYAEVGAGWEPPFPYRPEDVLLDLQRPTRPLEQYRAERSAHYPLRGHPPNGSESGVAPTVGSPSGPAEQDRSRPALVSNTCVLSPFGPIGVVDHLLVDSDSGEVAYLVVRAGDGLPKDSLIPVDWIQTIDADGILIDATPDQLAALPEYREPHKVPAPIGE